MKPITLPNTDLTVSALCCGGSFGPSFKGDEADRLVEDYLELGGNFFDTAHCYSFWEPGGNGAGERELGASLARLGVRDRVVIATKGGHPAVGDGYPRPEHFLDPALIASDITESLERLGSEPIDLYFLHRDDGKTPVSELVDYLKTEIGKGRIRHFAASNWSVERIAEANAYAKSKSVAGFVASQIQFSLAVPNWKVEPTEPTVRYVTDHELTWHRESSVPLITYSATASGYFTGNGRLNGAYDNEENQARRERANELAQELDATPTQIAVAYLMHQPGVTVVPIFGTTKRDHLKEILGADAITLTPEQVRYLREG